MIKAIAVDDEQPSLDLIVSMVRMYFSKSIFLVDSCNDIEDALVSIETNRPNLLFLDICIKGKTAFDLLKKIDTKSIDVIFVTAHSEYAIKAIRHSAIDYLMKPLDIVSFNTAVKRYLSKRHKDDKVDRLDVLLKSMESFNPTSPKVAFSLEKGFKFVSTAKILYCSSDSNYCHVYLIDGQSFVVSKTLKYIETTLPDDKFLRVHKSYLVNRSFIAEYLNEDGGYLMLNTGDKIPVSNRKKKLINEILLG